MSQSTEADATHPKTIFHLQRKKNIVQTYQTLVRNLTKI